MGHEVAVVFPGQGSQRTGMAKDFCERFAASKAVFDEASEALGLDLGALCWQGDPRLDLTEYTQPAILTAEIAMLRGMQSELGFSATRFGGHSLGEYTALTAAGALPLASAVRLVRRRGALMQQAVPAGEGAMSAVIASGIIDRIASVELDDLGVDIANKNSVDQVVISGPTTGIELAEKRIAESLQGGDLQIVRLNVSAPFHSRMMRGIEAPFRAELEQAASGFSIEKSVFVTSNLRGGFHDGASMVDALVGQISGTVDFIANMRALSAVASRIYEIGPNKPLRRFFGTIGVELTSIMNVRNAEKAAQEFSAG
jgi:[acyl-carrier-protein] S-malonyltransferase/trans-AT polyketide synthase/acyltransferase/oxidoreductase domain-containing protein